MNLLGLVLFPKQNYNVLSPNLHIHVSVNVGMGNEAGQFHFWEYIIGFSVQCM